ncbi:TonB-dependent receptor [Massilia violaceinigra]|uniref:TonB-dependent receptor n=1 Tax=Massilia violaceinigra TaxID=2045208 RepID=A0ABY4A736_9BURK|nr:TonB-dependent receptor [Massilia violaceinigra]UOD30462.1 TonB-dependent receptor [Massilia violaceinigra]
MRKARFIPLPFAFASLLSAAAAAPVQPPAPAPVLRLDLPSRPLGDALNDLARQANLQLGFAPALVSGKTAPAVAGNYTAQQALARLLQGSGLAGQVEQGAVLIRPAPGAPEQVTMKEVTVTAAPLGEPAQAREQGYRLRRSAASGFREQAVLDTPFSVSAFSAELIQDQQAKSLADVVKNDPSVTLASDPMWFDRVMVRGFYLGVDAVKRDGLTINDQGSIALQNKASVELAKGLSALRHGLTSPGGVVNYIVKRPGADSLSRLTVSANDDGALGAHADLGRRFGQDRQFGVRLNAAADKLRNHVPGYQGDKQFLSGAFEWQAGDALLLEADIEHQRSDKQGPGSPNILWWNTLAEARAAFARLDAKSYAAQDWAVEPNRQTYLGARATYQLGEHWKLALAGHRARLARDQRSINPRAMRPNGEYDASLYFSPDQERNNSSVQLVLEGDVRSGALAHALAVGVDSVRRDMLYGDGFSGPIGQGNLFAPRPIADPAPAVGAAYLANRADQRALFASDTISLGQQWQVFGGLRHTRIAIHSGSAGGVLRKTYDKAATTPALGLLFKPAAGMSLYASYAEGLEQGGTAPPGSSNQDQVMNPLESRQLELGAKAELGGALLTGALFRIDKGLEYTNADKLYVQDGSQLHQGVEVTLGGPLTRNLRLLAGAAWLKARVEETASLSLIGKRPQGVPAWQANLFADYALGALAPGLSLNGGVYYGGKKAVDLHNTWMASGYLRFDAGVRYEQALAAGRRAVLRLTLENLADRRYLANTNGGALTFGAPRSARASLAMDF